MKFVVLKNWRNLVGRVEQDAGVLRVRKSISLYRKPLE
jgi:hypothetical protein